MRVVAVYPYRHQAEEAAGVLEAAGIQVAVLIDEATRAGTHFINQVRVGVRDDLADHARAVLRAANLLAAES